MVIPPRAWHRDGTQIVGGYHIIAVPFISAEHWHHHTANNLAEISDYDIEATNILQRTPLRINVKVLDVLKYKLAARHEDEPVWRNRL